MYLAASSKTVSNSRGFIKKDPTVQRSRCPRVHETGKQWRPFSPRLSTARERGPPGSPPNRWSSPCGPGGTGPLPEGAGVPPAGSRGRCHTCGPLRFPTRWCAGQASPDPLGRRGKQTGPGCLAPVGSPASPSRPAPGMSVQARERTPASIP